MGYHCHLSTQGVTGFFTTVTGVTIASLYVAESDDFLPAMNVGRVHPSEISNVSTAIFAGAIFGSSLISSEAMETVAIGGAVGAVTGGLIYKNREALMRLHDDINERGIQNVLRDAPNHLRDIAGDFVEYVIGYFNVNTHQPGTVVDVIEAATLIPRNNLDRNQQ